MPAPPANQPEIKTQGDTKNTKVQTGDQGGGFSNNSKPRQIRSIQTQKGIKATPTKNEIKIEIPAEQLNNVINEQTGILNKISQKAGQLGKAAILAGALNSATPDAENLVENSTVSTDQIPTEQIPTDQTPGNQMPTSQTEEIPSENQTAEEEKTEPPKAPTDDQLKNIGPQQPPTVPSEQQTAGNIGPRGEQTNQPNAEKNDNLNEKIRQLAPKQPARSGGNAGKGPASGPLTTPPPAAPTSSETATSASPPTTDNPQATATDIQSGQSKKKQSLLQKFREKETRIKATALAEGATKIPTIGPILNIVLTIFVGMMQLVEMPFGKEGGAMFATWILTTWVLSSSISLLPGVMILLPVIFPISALLALCITPIVHGVTYERWTKPYIQAFRKRYAVSLSRLKKERNAGGNILEAVAESAAKEK